MNGVPLTFVDFMKTHLPHETENLLLLVSGGVDSMVLLDVVSKNYLPNKLFVLYFNHQTRPKNYQESSVVKSFCDSRNISFKEELVPIPTNNKENSWRKFRQNFSNSYAQSINACAILTAHHATDLVETMLFRLTKGCGVRGLSPFESIPAPSSFEKEGMFESDGGGNRRCSFHKPFWKIPKTSIIKYAKQNKLKWIEDETNDDTTYHRNLIRHNVLPELRKITPNLEQVFVNESQTFAAAADFIASQVPEAKPSIGLKEILALPLILQTEYLRSICPKTPSISEMIDFMRWIKNNPEGGSQKSLGGKIFKLQRGQLL